MFVLLRVIFVAVLTLVAALCGFVINSIDKAVVNPKRRQLDSYTSSDGNSGSFEKNGTLTILNLHGSYDEMGQQYGALAYNQLNEMYQTFVPQYFSKFSYKTILSFLLRSYYNWKLDPREREILQGMAKTSDLNYRQLLSIEVLTIAMDIFNDRIMEGHCSLFSVWGKRSKSDTMLVGRNLDLIEQVGQLDNYNSLVIYNPTGTNDNSVATFSFIGFIPGFTMVNSRGLFFEYNDARSSVKGYHLLRGHIGVNTGFYGLLSSKTRDEFIQGFKDRATFASHFGAVIDKDKSQSLERPVQNQLRVLDGQGEGYLFFTNLYRTPDFKNSNITIHNCIEKIKDSPTYAAVRYHHFEKFIANNEQFDSADIKTFFYTSLDDGGIYQPGNSKNYPVKEITIHTVIGDLSTGEFIYSNHQNKDLWINLSLYKYFAK